MRLEEHKYAATTPETYHLFALRSWRREDGNTSHKRNLLSYGKIREYACIHNCYSDTLCAGLASLGWEEFELWKVEDYPQLFREDWAKRWGCQDHCDNS